MTVSEHSGASLGADHQPSAYEQDDDEAREPVTYRGSDRMGAVRIVVDHGGRVIGIDVTPTWRTTIGVDGLPDAVLAAVTDATDRRTTTWATTAAQRLHTADTDRDTMTRDPKAAATPDAPHASAGIGVVNQEAVALTCELAAELRNAQHLIDTITATVAGHPTPDATTTTGPAGAATVTMTGQMVTAVTLDRHWLIDNHPDHHALADELLATFTSAYRHIDQMKARTRAWIEPIDRLHAPATSADTVMRQLGLDPR